LPNPIMQAVIVMDSEPRGFSYWGVVMSTEPNMPDGEAQVSIPSIFVSYETGVHIKKKFNAAAATCRSNDKTVLDRGGVFDRGFDESLSENNGRQCSYNDGVLVSIDDMGDELLKPERVSFGI
jgi:hypothetical protein